MTDLDAFVEQKGREDLVNEVRRKIDALDIRYVYIQYPTVTGRIVGKGIPAQHWEHVARMGVQLVYGSVANLATDRRGRYLGYGAEASELVAIPEPETFAQLPWDKKVARVFATLFRNREEPEEPGAYLMSDCRGNLRRLHDDFARRRGNLRLRVGTEPEMMWLKRDQSGALVGATRPNCYHIDQFESLRPVVLRTLEYARALGFDMIQGDHEDAPGQLELNFTFDDAVRNADRLVTYRQICGQVAREFELIATFMTKPFQGVSASGCHHNLSLWRGGKDTLVSDETTRSGAMPEVFIHRRRGENVFLRPDGGRLPSSIGLSCIGGLIKHLPALTAIGSSTVNSYRRLWDTGFWAPVYADWGYQNRTCALRISEPGRLEYRSVDSMVNPYLMSAALLAAFDAGIQENLDPGEPESRNVYEAEKSGKAGRRLPMHLGQALEALEADEIIRTARPGDMYRVFMDCKRIEWEKFLATTTEWDLETYLEWP